jgi:hypothetical protein
MNSDRAPQLRHFPRRACAGRLRLKTVAIAVCFLCASARWALAALQFDVFLGYDGLIPEACWFPVVCEVKNDGPSFTGTVEIKGGFSQDQSLLTTVELPTGTLKRFVLPVFSNGRGYASWDVRLLDERGRVRSEQLGLRARKQLAQGAPLLGALPRTPGGTPIIRAIVAQNSDLQPAAARLLPSIFPDNPLVLEGMSAIYLNSERVADLTINQVDALLGWLNAGGHLIVAVEQPSDISSAAWLRNIFPCEVRDLRTLPQHPEIADWLRSATWSSPVVRSSRMPNQFGAGPDEPEAVVTNPFPDLPNDLDFESKEMQIASSQLRDGKVELAAGDAPLIVTSQRGRGRLTALLFSPEREPMRSWRQLPTFWAKLAEVPGSWFRTKEMYSVGGWSTDGVFGAMIDTRQVHKLPVGWLLVLLLVYLVVIGPFDQFWLKRIGKPMLTWITFPCYVVLFSLVIYFIGYKLRAGESEWNELHVVDVLSNGTRAELRGHTYASVYSPANQRYSLVNQQKFATLRSELMSWNNSSGEQATIVETSEGFKAEIFVPVWTSELLVSDWWQSAPLPVVAAIHSSGDGWEVHYENKTGRKLANVQLAIEDRLFNLGDLGSEESKTQSIARRDGVPLKSFVSNYGGNFQNAVSSRQHAIGSTSSGQIADKPNSAVAVSFIGQLSRSQMNQNSFIAPPGLELSPVLEHGGAVLLAWSDNYSPIKPIEQFSPRRSQRDTLWRLALKVE